MSDHFPAFAKAIHERLTELSKNELYVTDALDLDKVYLQAYPEGTNPEKDLAATKLEVVKAIIAVKQEEARKAGLLVQRAEKRRVLLEAMAAKQRQELTEGSLEDLQRKFNELDSEDSLAA